MWLREALRDGDDAYEARVLAMGCEIAESQTVDCSTLGALTVQLVSRDTGRESALFVLFVQRDDTGQVGIAGGTGAVSHGPVTEGGPERRLLVGWTGSKNGDWYFRPRR